MSMAILANATQKLYSFSTYDIIPQHNAVPLTSVRTGAATILRQVGNFYVLGMGTLGVAQSGTSVTSAFAGGGLAVYRWSSGLTFEVGARLVKAGSASPAVYEFGFGRTF